MNFTSRKVNNIMVRTRSSEQPNSQPSFATLLNNYNLNENLMETNLSK